VAILPIYIYDQGVLRKKARPVKAVSEDLASLAASMLETMHGAGGVGLAANQVGSLDRIIVVDLSGMEEAKDFVPLVMINPEIVAGQGAWVIEEGCLSIPEIREEVERPDRIRVRYRDLAFAECEIEVEGFLGRVIQHEIDHLNGVLFIDHLSAVKRKLLRGRLNKLKKGEVEVDYPVVSNGPNQPKHAAAHVAAKE
jgi:peptide deformylase